MYQATGHDASCQQTFGARRPEWERERDI